ncbi:50S ribosomal protein L7ae-like protein [Ornithinibacillus sp. L9]|uniref:50S ribosomal protein L7ae-like protein n=1 Tax=Ornithinibacillus caprae TaxID=2678566 RepID=A0A6N8FLW2_9BACI|nr:ribosomal L7Ae/L30e/S12e/Gadd45 family protein [Ornithinibacillus caprae]MUK90465.1 50S ribosomal protein L7ae-like protein [Ornithinibacillus caprae]
MSYEKVTQLQSKVIIGTKQTLKAMKNGEISEVIVADDADQQLIRKVLDLAKALNIPCERVNSKKKLGIACGIDVSASTVAIKKDSFGE